MSPRQNNRKRHVAANHLSEGDRPALPELLAGDWFASAPVATLLDQRPGLIIITTLVGFVLFDFSHVFRPGIALAWLDLWKRREGGMW